jgi:hypothetical protein
MTVAWAREDGPWRFKGFYIMKRSIVQYHTECFTDASICGNKHTSCHGTGLAANVWVIHESCSKRALSRGRSSVSRGEISTET